MAALRMKSLGGNGHPVTKGIVTVDVGREQHGIPLHKELPL
jgi:hypothetical protein